MDEQQLDDIKLSLLTERQRLQQLIERTSKHLYRRDEPYSADFAEQAIEVENNQVVEALDQDAKVDIAHIDKALQRIDKGDYGLCTQCGEAIDPARLQAIPAVAFCIDCARRNEA